MRRQLSLSAARAVVEKRLVKRRQREQVLKQRGITPRRIVKARKDRAEDAHAAKVRALCVERDGDCRVQRDCVWPVDSVGIGCCGVSQWCHSTAKKRSRTRNMAPDVRHTTADSFMGCQRHHDMQERGELIATPRTDRGFDGPVDWSLKCR